MGKCFCHFNGYEVKDANARRNVTELQNKTTTLESRMNTFSSLPDGSTSGDAELIDARVDYNGNTHENVGEHIRSVSNEFYNEIEGLSYGLGEKINTYNNNIEGWQGVDSPIMLDRVIKAGETIKDIYCELAIARNPETHPNTTVYIFNANTLEILDTLIIPFKERYCLNKKYDVDVCIGGFLATAYLMNGADTQSTINNYIGLTVNDDNTVTLNKTQQHLKICYAIEINVINVQTRIQKIENKISKISIEQKNVLIVSKDGAGDFTTINEALNYANTYMSRENEITIQVNPGVYNEVVNVLGNKFISIVGVNRETCIIRDDTGIYTNCPLRIEGNSYIANLTLISTHKNNNNFIVDGVLKCNPSYALHIDDRHADDDNEYVCTVYNCKMYSEQNPAVGIGLDKNQTVNLIDCEIVTNRSEDMLNLTGVEGNLWGHKPNGGALFYHALYSGNYTNDNGYQKLVVRNCMIKNNANNVVVGEPGGMENQVELTFINNSGWSEKNGAIFVKGLNGATISPLSYGNNMIYMNYDNA